MPGARVILSLLISHHPPAQYSRTIRIRLGRARALRLCARCTGEAAGLVFTLCALGHLTHVPTPGLLAMSVVLPIPAIADWSTQAMEWRESSNPIRLLTGALFAAGCVLIGLLVARGAYVYSMAAMGIVGMEAALALRFLRRTGAIDRVMETFETYAEELISRPCEE